MRRIISILFIVALAFTMLVGCSWTPAQQDSMISIFARSAGYGVYRGIPDARPVLTTICLINDFSNPDLVAQQLKAALQKFWDDAKAMTDTDAQMIAMAVANLQDELNIQLANAKTERAAEILKVVVTKMCDGVHMAEPK